MITWRKTIEIKDDKLIIDNKEFYLDYYEEKEEESLLIINGMAFVVSKKTIDEQIIKEIKSPMNGHVNDILVKVNSTIEKGQGLVVLEAMKMFNEIKSPIKGEIKNILVQKNQTVKVRRNYDNFKVIEIFSKYWINNNHQVK